MASSHHHDDVRGLDIIRATLKPTKMDHFKALVAHNFKVTLRSPTVYIFGAMIPLIMIGASIGIVSDRQTLFFSPSFLPSVLDSSQDVILSRQYWNVLLTNTVVHYNSHLASKAASQRSLPAPLTGMRKQRV